MDTYLKQKWKVERVKIAQCKDCSATTMAVSTGEPRCLDCRGGRLEPDRNSVWGFQHSRGQLGVVCDFLGISHLSGKLTKGDLLKRISRVTLTGPPALDDQSILDGLVEMTYHERQDAFPKVWKEWQNSS